MLDGMGKVSANNEAVCDVDHIPLQQGPARCCRRERTECHGLPVSGRLVVESNSVRG